MKTTEDKKIVLLSPVPKSFMWKVKVFIVNLFRLFVAAENRKPYDEFYYGMIDHKHEFDYENKKRDQYGPHFECKHYGCNVVSVLNPDGTFID